MNDGDLINTLIVMAGVESKQDGSMPMEDNPVYLAAMLIKDLKERIAKQTSALRRIRGIFRDDNYDAVSSVKALRKLAFVIDQTGEQHLDELLADTYWKGYVAGGDDFRSRTNMPLEVVTKKANELIVKLYPESILAKKITNGAKQ